MSFSKPLRSTDPSASKEEQQSGGASTVPWSHKETSSTKPSPNAHTSPSKSTNPLGTEQQLTGTIASSSHVTSPPSPNSSDTTQEHIRDTQTSSTASRPTSSHTRSARVLAQTRYWRLKQLMQQAREELSLAENGGAHDEDKGEGNEGAARGEETMTRVVEMLQEAESISDALGRELTVEPETEEERKALVAKLEALNVGERVDGARMVGGEGMGTNAEERYAGSGRGV